MYDALQMYNNSSVYNLLQLARGVNIILLPTNWVFLIKRNENGSNFYFFHNNT